MIFIYIIASLLIITLGVSFWAYHRAFYRSPRNFDPYDLPKGEQYEPYHEKMRALMREMEALKGEKVSIRAYDGVKLYATYYHLSDDAPLQIEFHGYRSDPTRDLCGGNKLSRELGHNTLVVIQRATGISGGRTITFGIKESRDCLSWIEYAIARFGTDKKIILSGVSMGGATVLTVNRFELPENVVGIVADCPFSNPKEIIKRVCKKLKYPPNVTFPFIWLGGLIFGHFSITSTDALRATKNAKIPILIIHGEDDRFVPAYMSKDIYEGCKENCELHIFPNAGHGMSYIVDTEKYTEIVNEFTNRVLEN